MDDYYSSDEAFQLLMQELEDESEPTPEAEYEEYATIFMSVILNYLFKKEEFGENSAGKEAASAIIQIDDELMRIAHKNDLSENQIILKMMEVTKKYIKKYS